MSCLHSHPASPKPRSRREVIQRIVLGSGAAVLSTLPASGSQAAGAVDAVLLTCMDYRLENEVVAYMDGRGLRDRYDRLVLAGASLGVLTDQRSDWGKTFWQHLDVAIQLHQVHKVIVLDHKDCGAYRVFLGADAVSTAAAEIEAHTQRLKQLGAMIAGKHPDLEVELLIMSLDGTVQQIA